MLFHTEGFCPMDMTSEYPTLQPLACIHFMDGRFMGRAEEVSRGAEAGAVSLVAGEDSVVGGNCMGDPMEFLGIGPMEFLGIGRIPVSK